MIALIAVVIIYTNQPTQIFLSYVLERNKIFLQYIYTYWYVFASYAYVLYVNCALLSRTCSKLLQGPVTPADSSSKHGYLVSTKNRWATFKALELVRIHVIEDSEYVSKPSGIILSIDLNQLKTWRAAFSHLLLFLDVMVLYGQGKWYRRSRNWVLAMLVFSSWKLGHSGGKIYHCWRIQNETWRDIPTLTNVFERVYYDCSMYWERRKWRKQAEMRW